MCSGTAVGTDVGIGINIDTHKKQLADREAESGGLKHTHSDRSGDRGRSDERHLRSRTPLIL
jgi:hypothetical protein